MLYAVLHQLLPLQVVLISTILILNVGKPTVNTLYSEQHFSFTPLT